MNQKEKKTKRWAFLKEVENWKGAEWTIGKLPASHKRPSEDYKDIKIKMWVFPQSETEEKSTDDEAREAKPGVKKRTCLRLFL